MKAKQQAIAGCIEVATTSTLTLTTDIGAYTVSPTLTVFENVLTLAIHLNQRFALVHGGTLLRMWTPGLGDIPPLSEPYEMRYAFFRAGHVPVSVTGSLASTLGFGGIGADEIVVSGANALIVAANRPNFLWLPEHYSSDDGFFMRPEADVFSGSVSRNGRQYGYTPPVRAQRAAQWPAEQVWNVIPDTGTAAQNSRCLLSECDRARGMSLVRTTSGNVYCKGVYLINDLEACVRPVSALRWNSGTMQGNYIFCSVLGVDEPVPVNPQSRLWYSCGVQLVHAVAPNWPGATL